MSIHTSTHTPGPWKWEWSHERGKPHRLMAESASSYHVKILSVRPSSFLSKYDSELIASAPLMYDFINDLASQQCYDEPGEYPESGETGKAPCLACRAKAIVQKVKA